MLALDFNGTKSNLLGLGLALMASVGVAVLLIGNERIHRGQDSRAFTLHMQGTAMIGFCAVAIMSGNFLLPVTLSG